MMTTTCLEVEEPAGRRSHCWQGTGLDVVGGVLCTTRRCVWCGRGEHKTYGARHGSWRRS